METIIGLLFILLPLIFKLIGRKFEQSGQDARAEKMRKIAEAFGAEEASDDVESEDDDVEYDDDGQITYVPPVQVPVRKPEPLYKPVYERPVPSLEGRPAVSRKPLLVEEEKKKRHEKIDPKKLVIYSEIMKPKF